MIATRSAATKIYGWENEATFKLSADDSLDASVAFEKSRYVNFLTGAAANIDWSGKSLDKTPAAAARLYYSHIFDLNGGSTLQFRIGTKYSTSYKLSDFVDAVQYTQAAYTRSDVNLNWTSADHKLTVQAYIHNLEDKMQAQSYTAPSVLADPNGATAAVSEPRMMGVRIGFKY